MQNTITLIWRRIVAWFLAGLLAVLPLALTLGIIIWVAGLLQQFVGPGTVLGVALQSVGFQFAENKWAAYGIGCLFVLVTIFFFGIILEMGAKRYFQKLTDALLQRIPLVRSIYSTSRQMVEMFDRRGESDMQAMNAVFCTFGDKGGPGLLALMPSPEKIRINDRDYHAGTLWRRSDFHAGRVGDACRSIRRRIDERLRVDGRDRA